MTGYRIAGSFERGYQALEVAVPPAMAPLSPVEAREHLRLNPGEDESGLARAIDAATAQAETLTGRSLIRREYRLWRHAWPRGGVLRLPMGPVIAVTEIALLDEQDQATLLLADDWILAGSDPGRVLPRLGWPPVRRCYRSIRVRYEAGYGDRADLPGGLRAALLALTAWHYQNHGDQGNTGAATSDMALELLAPYRRLLL